MDDEFERALDEIMRIANLEPDENRRGIWTREREDLKLWVCSFCGGICAKQDPPDVCRSCGAAMIGSVESYKCVTCKHDKECWEMFEDDFPESFECMGWEEK